MMARFQTPLSRNGLTGAFALTAAFPALCAAQRAPEVIPANVPPPSVYVFPPATDDPRTLNLFTVPERDDPWADIDQTPYSLDPLLRLWKTLPGGELNWPPDHPKMPGEPPRVQPSKKNPDHWDAQGRRKD